jgi:hypothetical protein
LSETSFGHLRAKSRAIRAPSAGAVLFETIQRFAAPTAAFRSIGCPEITDTDDTEPDDRLTAVREKLEEYKAWGVPHVWLVDPHAKRLYMCDHGLMKVSSLQIPELGIEPLPDRIFD